MADGSRPERREALALTTAFESESHVALAREALSDPNRDVRLAAAAALLHAGDRAGAEDLLAALDDPVEGPEVHAALVRWHGEDPGRPAGAWEPILLEAPPPSRGGERGR
jgi:HEAT repeat protein